jgi:hypothetical protein
MPDVLPTIVPVLNEIELALAVNPSIFIGFEL